MVKIYDYIFYSIYRNTIITNKSIPDWSTVVAISSFLSLNIFSILIFADHDIESMDRKVFGSIPLVCFGLNYLYFLKDKRHHKILSRFEDQKNKFLWDFLVLIYISISVFIFIGVLGFDLITTLIITGFVALSGIIPWGKKRFTTTYKNKA